MNLFEFDKPYDREKFLNFMVDFLPEDFTPRIEPLALSDFTPKCAQQATRLGISEILQLEVLEIVHSSSHDARVAIAQDAFKLLLHKSYKNRALVIFLQKNSAQYRLSLLQIEAVQDDHSSRIRRSYSNPRRYSFLLGEGAHVKTPYQFLIRNGKLKPVDGDYFKDLQSRFSVETLTKLFYKELSDWYFWAMDQVEFPDDEDQDCKSRNAKSLIRMITRIIFIWFMKEKQLISANLFDKSYVDTLLNYSDATGSTYYKAILQNLFFATLNTPMRKDNPQSRIFIEDAKKFGFVNDGYLQQGYFRYSRFIKDKEAFLKEFDNIPFLNGGLFESLDKKVDDRVIRIDCFSDHPKNETRLKVPDDLFFSKDEQEADLSSYLENGNHKKVRGLITILESYNFTVEENTPLDEEVALDPELLGNVFENLLASYNPETATTARKSTGSYYTPREIVDYMVTESLIEHFSVMLGGDEGHRQKLRSLFSYIDDANPFDDEADTRKMLDCIEKIQILDPACGSGAFPMSILHHLVLALHKLDPENQKWKANLLAKVPTELKTEVEKSLQNKSLDYIRKLGLIENCIFGVDIQEIAIQISKLRFFISLLIEQEVDDSKENRDIRALPNLETKFVAANTLISLEADSDKKEAVFKSAEVEALEENLFAIREKIFYTNSRSEKIRLEKQLTELRFRLKDEFTNLGFPNDKSDKITSWDPFDQNTHAEWFDPEWMFGIKDGFDIVIGNPPYIQLQKACNGSLKYADLYKNQSFTVFERTGDIYGLFYEKGMSLLREGGHLAFITSNKWMRAGYGEKLRRFFTQYNPKILIDLGPNVFENATVDTNILLIQKAKNQHCLRAVTVNEKNKNQLDFTALLRQNGMLLTNLSADAWFIGSNAEQQLKEKIERIGKPLKEWDVNIYYGIKTGLNEAFIIDSDKRQEILDHCRDEEERRRTEAVIKPILRGRDIKRYAYHWAGLWVIGTFPALKLNIEDYPAIKRYLLSNFDIRQLEQSGKKYSELGFNARKKTTNKWFETQDPIAYYPEFEKEKVAFKAVGKNLAFGIVPPGVLITAPASFMTSTRNKYIMGFLCSKYSLYFILKNSDKTGAGDVMLNVQSFEKIPIPPITSSNQPIVSQIESLVDAILSAKKDNPAADTSALEQQIDHLVYRLYDLTEEEIKIVENQNG
ncbi:MAG: N-6 DNA methylase [Rikenellaceae bacterium]